MVWKFLKKQRTTIRVYMLNRFSHTQLFVILYENSLSGSSVHGTPRQEYWNGLPCLPPGDLPNPGMELVSLKSPVLTGGFFTTSAAPVVYRTTV